MTAKHVSRGAGALALGASGAFLLAVAQPAGRLPTLSGVPAWLAVTPADEAAVSLAWLVGWVVVAWLTALALLAAAAAVPGGTGTIARWLLRLVAPRAARRALEVALGLSLAAGPALGGVAHAAAPPAAPHGIELSVPSLDRPLSSVPSLDRPVERPGQAMPSLDRPHADTRPRTGVPPRTDPQPVTVHRGDSLWLIASRGLGGRASEAQIAAEWPRWYAANRAVVGDDPELIQPGQRLVPPHATGPHS
jgi:nucleoid-associated protein YgaU